MKVSEFEKMFKDVMSVCDKTLNKKNADYARGGDKLSNFKLAAHLERCTSVKACGGMMAKHTVAVYDYINDHEKGIGHTLSQWDEKIIDSINYLILLRALIVDEAREGNTDEV